MKWIMPVRKMKAGSVERTPFSERLRQWLVLAGIYLGAYLIATCIMLALGRPKSDRWWLIIASQVVGQTIWLMHMAYDRERAAYRNLPCRAGSAGGQVEIRDCCGRVLRVVEGCGLSGIDLAGAKLQDACLWGERLEGAHLAGTDLQGAWLRAAVLDRADLRHANLSGTDLRHTQLRQADLRGADLRGAKLRHADLQGAIYDDATRWTTGVDPRRLGCVRVHEPHPRLPLPTSAPEASPASLPVPAGGE